MTDIYEQADTSLVDVLGEVMPKLHSKYVNVVQPLIDDETYTLVPYAAGPLELAAAIAAKKAAIDAHFEMLHGMTCQEVKKIHDAAQPAFVLTANAVTNLGKANAAGVAVAALTNKAAAEAFDVVNTPTWVS